MEAGVKCRKVFMHSRRSVLAIMLSTGLLYKFCRLHQNQSRRKSSRFYLLFPKAGRSETLHAAAWCYPCGF